MPRFDVSQLQLVLLFSFESIVPFARKHCHVLELPDELLVSIFIPGIPLVLAATSSNALRWEVHDHPMQTVTGNLLP